MDTFRFKLHVASDGIVRLDFPTGYGDVDVELLVVIATSSAQRSPDAIDTARSELARAYMSWSPAEDEKPLGLRRAGHSVEEMSRQLQRQPGAIRSRLRKLGEDSCSSAPPDAV